MLLHQYHPRDSPAIKTDYNLLFGRFSSENDCGILPSENAKKLLLLLLLSSLIRGGASSTS
ncbi:hypothetical protein PtA15_15A438 [Puccinia triticina]|uniref:Uncharacterized protein n=1 Tax=Puccinia triticina TaxID=208348 RepID=A0ABY7D4K9_9BASI|nr:uncharacterized protein PtA15_15A438 [Puccinia triticina]WAQ92043.1 hypothetical protein PtA15_15A438 [Puccinia triticina]